MKKLSKRENITSTAKKLVALQEYVKALEERIFKPKEEKKTTTTNDIYWGTSWVVGSYFPIKPQSLEWEIEDLQDKLDAVIKFLKIHVSKTQAKESEYVAKLIKKSK